jgi:hypothetical protein
MSAWPKVNHSRKLTIAKESWFPMDFSAAAQKALRYAQDLAAAISSPSSFLLHVVAPSESPGS